MPTALRKRNTEAFDFGHFFDEFENARLEGEAQKLDRRNLA
jgi:hypothetical protein